jgi:cytoskeletal protein RodZ
MNRTASRVSVQELKMPLQVRKNVVAEIRIQDDRLEAKDTLSEIDREAPSSNIDMHRVTTILHHIQVGQSVVTKSPWNGS